MLRPILYLGSLCLMASLSIASLSSMALAAPAAKARPAVKGLSKEEAIRRVAAVANVRYDLSFSLSDDEKEKNFSGVVTARFDVQDASAPLTLDFADGDVKELVVNGVKQAKIQYNKQFVTLPALKAGANEIVLRFTHPYSTTGAGLYRFKDPEDGKSYVYTDFEPFDANSLFPCFDQPDLKATYTVAVEAPAAWTVITSVRESAAPTVNGQRASWAFPESAKFSTYLFSLHAGPYQMWESKAGDIPLRLFARASLGKYVAADEWFKITQQGLAFFGDYFAFPYPFKKYDQVIVPDFNAGAMENVAAVTFSERYVPRGATTNAQREGRANVILHEMAHMWFGDLVTMRWWNDLWLNESFATYMATLALVEATEFKRAWESFYNGTKQWAYWEDQLVTTHPIEGDVPDTEQAFANFDGITYGKGASTQKALAYYIGADKFRDGVRAYFKKYAYGNTELKDFMGSLAAASGKDLEGWTQDWLRTAGLNTVEATFACDGGKIKDFKLNQTAAADHPELRAHGTQVALFRKNNGKIELQKSVAVQYQGASTAVPALNGEACPHIVYPNYEDYDFVKVRLDRQSLANVKTDLNEVEDSLQRSMYWTSLWDAVRDGEWPVTAYADTVLQRLGKEKDDKIIDTVLDTVHAGRRGGASVLTYLPPASPARQAFVTRIETFANEQLTAAAPGSDVQKLWFDFYVKVATSAEGQTQISKILAGDVKLPGFELDQDRRWDVIAQLSELGAPNAKALRLAEVKRDGSSRGKQSAITCEVLVPEKAVKTAWYAKIVDPKTKMTLADLRAAMGGMMPLSQTAMVKDFGAKYFADLPRLAKGSEGEFARRFASSMAPSFCDDASAKALAQFAAKHKELPASTLKAVRVAAQEDGRCVNIRKVATTGQGI